MNKKSLMESIEFARKEIDSLPKWEKDLFEWEKYCIENGIFRFRIPHERTIERRIT